MKKILIVDYSNLMFRMINVHQNLTYHSSFTGGVYGFFNQLCLNINKHKPDYIIIANDYPPYKRKEVYLDYKSNRPAKADAYVKKCIDETRIFIDTLLELLDLPLIKIQGYEFDDICAYLVFKYKKEYEIIIYSGDDDLFQLLDKNIILQRGKNIYTIDSFKQEYPTLNPIDWRMIKAMAGDHNNIKNLYKGLGIKTAIKLHSNLNSYLEITKQYEKELRLNLSLTRLPFDDKISIQDEEVLYSPKFSQRRVENYLMKNLGFIITKVMEDFLNEIKKD